MMQGYSQSRDLWEEKLHIRSHTHNRQYDWIQTASQRSFAITDLTPQGHVTLIDRIIFYLQGDATFPCRFFLTKSPIDPYNANAFRAPDMVWAFDIVQNLINQIGADNVTYTSSGTQRICTQEFSTPIVIRPEDNLHCRLLTSISSANMSLSLGCRLAMTERGTWPYTDTRIEAGNRGTPNHPGDAGPIDPWNPSGDGLPVGEPEYRQGDANTSAPGEGRMSRDVRDPQS